ncbi:MAG: Nucleosomal histone H3-Lys79 methylase [Claussenomyces sp. TS43310]|nr:MAG: Nucleosomal histone H3-Lys79 methylase [Claussenomyces sp. TS43310]
MSLWGKKSSKRQNAPTIRSTIVHFVLCNEHILTVMTVEKVAVKPSPGPITKVASRSQTQSTSISRSVNAATPELELKPRKLANPRKRSPAIQRVESDSDDDGDDDSSTSYDFTHKKAKTVLEGATDNCRQLRSLHAFTDTDKDLLIHAADIASMTKRFTPAFGVTKEDVFAELQYPGAAQRERYELVLKKGDFNPIEEIIGVVNDVSDFFLPPTQIEAFRNVDTGLVRRLERAKNVSSMDGFRAALGKYNTVLDHLRQDGSLVAHINKQHNLPLKLINRIMRQTYDRAVSPKVDLLRKYENGTDFIYGELKTIFVYNILVETQIRSDQVFVDLGSGVANVVLQAALQIGCESWGGEIMENACTLAEAQRVEFEARCRMWGIEPGAVKLERGDFMDNTNIRSALKRADVVLVNNEVFTPALNNDLINLFLDLKDGCRIVSLKSFVPHNHKITSYNLNNPVNLLDVEQKAYSSKSVSWKDEGGYYFIATKDSKRLRSYDHLS